MTFNYEQYGFVKVPHNGLSQMYIRENVVLEVLNERHELRQLDGHRVQYVDMTGKELPAMYKLLTGDKLETITNQ
jgi:hypothetical protein